MQAGEIIADGPAADVVAEAERLDLPVRVIDGGGAAAAPAPVVAVTGAGVEVEIVADEQTVPGKSGPPAECG